MYKNKKLVSLVLSLALSVTFFDTGYVKAESTWAAHKAEYTCYTSSGYNYYEPVSHEDGINVKYWKGSCETRKVDNEYIDYDDTRPYSYRFITDDSDGIETVNMQSHNMLEVDVSGMKRPVMQVYSEGENKAPGFQVYWLQKFKYSPDDDFQFASMHLDYFQNYREETDFDGGIVPLTADYHAEDTEVITIKGSSFFDETTNTYVEASFEDLVFDGHTSKRYIQIYDVSPSLEIYVYDYPDDYVNYNMKDDASKGSIVSGYGKIKFNGRNGEVYLRPKEENDGSSLQAYNELRVIENGAYEMDYSVHTWYWEDQSGIPSPVTEPITASSIYFGVMGIYDKVTDASLVNVSDVSIELQDGIISGDNLRTDIKKGEHNLYFLVSRSDGKALDIGSSVKLRFKMSGIDYENPDVMKPVGLPVLPTSNPEGTSNPGKTSNPGGTSNPENTTVPGGTLKPSGTPAQNNPPVAAYPVSNNTTATKEPEVSNTPETANTPEASKTPEVSKMPEVSNTPEAAKTPEVTTVPETTKAPEITRKPETTKAPEAGETPGAARTPEPVLTGKGEKTVSKNIEFQVTGNGNVAVSGINKENVKNIVIPGSIVIDGKEYKVTEINNSAFKGTDIESVQLGKNIITIENEAFKNCKKLKSVQLGDNIVKICPRAFKGCTRLNSIKFPYGVKIIGKGSFRNCTSLKKIELPDTVQEISMNAFRNCRKMQSFTLGTEDSGESNKKSALRTASNIIKVSIGASALENCSSLRIVIINSHVEKIGNSAFRYCSKLCKMIIKSLKLKKVGSHALKGVNNCKITVPSVKLEPYKILFKNKGQGKKVIIAKS